ncbi:MAG: hypothetical protein LOD91_01885 [Limnochordales bacterium]
MRRGRRSRGADAAVLAGAVLLALAVFGGSAGSSPLGLAGAGPMAPGIILEPQPLILGLHTGPDPLRTAASIPVAAALGAGLVPIDFEWARAQPAPDRFAWEDYDFAVRRARAHQLRPVGVLYYPQDPPWPGEEGRGPGGPAAHRIAWLAFVEQAVARFGWAITDWVLAREEPADADPLLWAREAVEHARLVQEAAAAIGRVQPGAQVRAAASAADLLWLEVFAREGGLGGLAGLVLEANRWPVPPEGLPVAIDEVRSLVREWGHDLELWVWRFGYPTHQGISRTPPHRRGVSPQEQAEYLVRSHVWLARAGVGAVLYHELMDSGWERDAAGSNFGLFQRDGQGKPAARAYRTLAQKLGGRTYGLPQPAVPGAADDVAVEALGAVLAAIRAAFEVVQAVPNVAVHPFAAGPGASLVVVLWAASPAAEDAALALPLEPLALPERTEVHVTGWDGTPLDQLPLGRAPVYVEIRAGAAPPAEPGFVEWMIQ